MALVTNILGTRTALTVTGLGTLASGTYVTSATLSLLTSGKTDLDCIVELTAATTNTPTGNLQVLVFAQASYDGGTTWQGGPGSGTSRTREDVLTFLGALRLSTTSTTEVRGFPVAQAYGGVCPPTIRFVFFNDLGVSLTSASVNTVRVTGDVT
jgi:hypothetical protein